jgi:hypothetical protein
MGGGRLMSALVVAVILVAVCVLAPFYGADSRRHDFRIR